MQARKGHPARAWALVGLMGLGAALQKGDGNDG
jgi:hypothetical protein